MTSKKAILVNFCVSLAASILSALIVHFILHPKISALIVIGIAIFIFSIVILYFRYIIHYYHSIIKHLHYSIQSVANIKIDHQGKESKFEGECKNKLVALLNSA